MLKKTLILLIPIVLLAAFLSYLFLWAPTKKTPTGTIPSTDPLSFNPLNTNGSPTTPNTSVATSSSPDVTEVPAGTQAPALRHLSTTPIGGFMASTTASSSVVRYVDRGVGHIFQAESISPLVSKVSNTTIPKVYESFWNKNLSVAIFRYLKDDTESIANFYAELRPVKLTASSTSDNSDYIPYEIKGKFLSSSIFALAVSPKKDRIFTYNIESGKGIGYISGFDESKKTKIFEAPLKQVSVEWPEENTLAITTKPSAVSSGYLYFFDIKKAVLSKALGGISGLVTRVSADGKKVLFSFARNNGVLTSIYNAKDNTTQEVVFKTIADKCVWSRLHTNDLYCAVPSKIDSGAYPDDWYRGNISFVDQIWHLDTSTGEVHLVANLLTLSNDLIDATDLTLDPKENFLYFTNKRDLTLWSLDLTR